jgi:hypothetical protein
MDNAYIEGGLGMSWVRSDRLSAKKSHQGSAAGFVRHPLISPHLPESRYPTLYGVFPSGDSRPSVEQIMEKRYSFPAHHYLLLDRKDLKTYVARREQSQIHFPLAEPEGEYPHALFVDDILMSRGTENYKAPSPEEMVEEVRGVLDAQLGACWDA